MSAAIFDHFKDLTDPRVNRGGNHCLYEMVVIALTSAICGANAWTDVERFGNAKFNWFKRFLVLEHGIPSHDTFGRVFAALDTEEFLACLQSWISTLQQNMRGEAVAIDGKVLRHSFDHALAAPSLHVVNAWATGLRICLGQITMPPGSSEVHVIPRLLEFLELHGAVVTLDALHCTPQIVSKIRDQGADYVLTLKKNQPTLFECVEQLFSDADKSNTRIRRHVTTEKSHGREERREYCVTSAPKSVRAKWKDIRSVGVVHRYRKVLTTGKVHRETRYFISSLAPRVRNLAKYVRGHWSVENELHWCLDVNFGEDASRIRKGNGQEIASIFRRLALSILQRDTTQKENIRGKRLIAGWNTDALEQILTGNKAA